MTQSNFLENKIASSFLALSTLLSSLLISAKTHASIELAVEPGWKVIHEDRRLKVLEREEEGSSIVAFRGVGVLKAPLHLVAALVLDHEGSTAWVPYLKTNKLLKFLSPTEYLEYNQMRTPPFTRNRDFLFKTKLHYEPKERKLIIRSESCEDPIMPESKDFIRGKAERIVFTLQENSEQTETYVSAEIKVDPMGSIPKWIVNLFQRTWPKKAFEGLEKEIERKTPHHPQSFQKLLAEMKEGGIKNKE